MFDAGERQPGREGQIVTFYSFKGGTGRTMALANVAWILAANGQRVLVADWDLESPGLHRFFQPLMEPGAGDMPGIVDFIRRYEWAAVDAKITPEQLVSDSEQAQRAAHEAIAGLIKKHIGQLKEYPVPLRWVFPGQGTLHFLSTGKQENIYYKSAMGALDWDHFYDYLHGGKYFDALRVFLKQNYDYVLIDSRTGLSDVADICTVHLPDMVMDCFTLSTQGIEGGAMIAKAIQRYKDRPRRILPVPMRIEVAEKEKLDAGRTFAVSKFAGLPAGMSDEQRVTYWAEVEVPYQPFYAYEETLAVFGDRPGSPGSLLSAYERIVGQITDDAVTALPPMEESRRLRTRLMFDRREPSSSYGSARTDEVVLDFSPQDQMWAEWFAAVLATAEIAVRWLDEVPELPADSAAGPRVIALVTESYIARLQDSPARVRPALAISVTDVRMPHQLANVPVVFLARLSESQAAGRLLERVSGQRPAEPVITDSRYPGGNRKQTVQIPARNANFTGRNQDLSQLREELRSRGTAVILPLAIQGLGGVGKTQVALEYVHRFKADYDVIWWINCGQSQYVDAKLYDLGQKMREDFGASIPEEGGTAEVVRRVLGLLREEDIEERWLIVYDNADDIETVKGLLPRGRGHGHVLITSREGGWASEGKLVKIDVFKREESVSHLRRRMPSIKDEEANQVAEILGDLPLAMAAAGAWLASTGLSVSDYLEELERKGPDTLDPAPGDYPESPDSPLRDYPRPVAKTWDLSLDQLQKKSAAAARLLELSSVMAPDIGLTLIYSQAMVTILRELDPSISEPSMVARLVRQIDLLALIKLDNNAHQIQVHRLVQAVVRRRLAAKGGVDGARRDVHQLLVAARPEGDVDNPNEWPRYQLIWPHLTPSEAMWSAEEPVRQLLIDRVRYLRQRDDLERGHRRAEEIERAWNTMLAQDPDPALAESLQRQLFRLQFNLANIMRDLAEFRTSLAIDEAVLEGQRALLGEEHTHTLSTRSSLAADLRALGDYKAGLELDRDTYQSWIGACGDEYPRTLSAANNLALSLLLTGDFEGALALDRVTLERRTSNLGSGHPGTLSSGAAVARDLLEAGRYAEAVAQTEMVWSQCKAALGDDDRATLNARLLLSVALRCAGLADLAAEHVDQARTGLVRGFGAKSSDALACRLSQALNLLALHDIENGRAEAEAVLAVYEERLGSAHPHSLICKLNISTALCMENKYPAAEDAARTAAKGLAAKLGGDHPYALAAQMVMASVLASQNRLTEARALEEVIATERERVLGPHHPDAMRSRVNLLLTEQDLGVGGASAARQALIEDLAAFLGYEHSDVATAKDGGRLLSAIDPQPF